MRPPEFFISKREKRKELAELLPSDLALVYGAGLKPHRWTFNGEMLGRKASKNEQDRIFFGALQKYSAGNLEGNAGEGELESLRIERFGTDILKYIGALLPPPFHQRPFDIGVIYLGISPSFPFLFYSDISAVFERYT